MRRGRAAGASDASHLAAAVPITVDGLGPRGGNAHNPGEFVLADSLRHRAEVALAVTRPRSPPDRRSPRRVIDHRTAPRERTGR